MLDDCTSLVPSVQRWMGGRTRVVQKCLTSSNEGKVLSSLRRNTFFKLLYTLFPNPPPFPLTRTQLATRNDTLLKSARGRPSSICDANSEIFLSCVQQCLQKIKMQDMADFQNQIFIRDLAIRLAAIFTIPVPLFSANLPICVDMFERSCFFLFFDNSLQSFLASSSSSSLSPRMS